METSTVSNSPGIRIIGADRAADIASTAASTTWGANTRQVRIAEHAPNPVRQLVHFDEIDLAHELDDHSDDAVWMQLERMLIAREAARGAHPAGARFH